VGHRSTKTTENNITSEKAKNKPFKASKHNNIIIYEFNSSYAPRREHHEMKLVGAGLLWLGPSGDYLLFFFNIEHKPAP